MLANKQSWAVSNSSVQSEVCEQSILLCTNRSIDAAYTSASCATVLCILVNLNSSVCIECSLLSVCVYSVQLDCWFYIVAFWLHTWCLLQWTECYNCIDTLYTLRLFSEMGSVANKKIVRKKFYTLEHSEWEVFKSSILELKLYSSCDSLCTLRLPKWVLQS